MTTTVMTDDKRAIFEHCIGIIKDMTVDWDADATIGNDTDIIGDLGFVSVDIIQLIVAIETHFQRRDFSFDKLLMQEGRYVDALYVRDIVDFVHRHLDGHLA